MVDACRLSINALQRSAERYAKKSRADGTLARYREHWAAFAAWGEAHGQLCALPAAPKTVALYLAARGCRDPSEHAGRQPRANTDMHRRNRLQAPKDPLFEETWGTRPVYRVTAERALRQ